MCVWCLLLQISKFLQLTKKIYWDIPDSMDKIFSMRTQQKLLINDLSTVDITEILDNTYSTIVINCETSESNVDTVSFFYINWKIWNINVWYQYIFSIM